MLVKFDTLLLWCLVQVCILCMQGGLSSPLTSLGRKAVSSSLSIAPSFFKSCDYQLYSPKLKQEVALSSLVNSCKEQGQRGSLLLFLTHAGDLSSFELTQQLLHYQAQLGDVNIVTIMPGATSANAEQFCTLTKLPAEKLYVDRSTNLYRELSFGGGFLHSQRQLVPAYLRLLPMLMGVGSPGTIQEVLRGYVGDRSAPSAWIKRSLRLVQDDKFDVLGTEYQRPFELATIRLQNMMDVLQHWDSLVPEDKDLLTQLGGAYALNKDGDILHEHKDSGILRYADLRKVVQFLDIDLKD